MTNPQLEEDEEFLDIDTDDGYYVISTPLVDFREWLDVKVGDKLPSVDGDMNITVREAKTDLKCRRCNGVIFTFCPYAQGSWRYSKYHIKCLKGH